MANIYRGQFKDIYGSLFTLDIGDTGTVVNLKFSASPFVTTMDQSDDIIYKPARYQSATVGLLVSGSDYHFGIYSGSAQGMKVTLKNSLDVVLWVGYVSPSMYNIGYAKALETLDVDCIDGLSTLQYYKYEPISGSPGIHTLKDILRHCVQKCGCYEYLDWHGTTTIDGNNSEAVANGYMSESCFVTSRQDDDNADTMTYQEVLESICQWLGVTAYAEGTTVKLVDYDTVHDSAVNSTAYTVYHMDVSNGTYLGGSDVATLYAIDGSTYGGSDTQLSLDNVYNKVTVGDDLNTFDAILIDYFEDVTNITADDPDILADHWRGQVGEYVDPGNGDPMLVMVRSVDGVQNSDAYNAIFVKYYSSPYYKFYRYTGNNNTATTAYDSAMNFTNTKLFNGAVIARMDVERLEDTEFVNTWLDNVISGRVPLSTLDEILAANEISSIDWSEYILMFNHETIATDNVKHIANSDITNYPYFKTTVANTPTSFFGGPNAYLVIEGSIIWHDDNPQGSSYKGNSPYPIPDGEVDIDNGRKPIDSNNAYLLCKMEWGGLYWNGTAWSGTPSTFKVYFSNENQRTDSCMFKSMSIINTVNWRVGTDAKGYLIPMPSNNAIVSSVPTLTVYKPMDFSTYYDTRFMALKDFKVTPIVSDPTFSGENDTDTVYTNVINLNNAQELDDIDFKVCTYDGKKPNYNAVAYVNGGQTYYVDTVTHSALASRISGTVRVDGSISSGELREEELMVWRIVNQYSNPAKILELTVHMGENIDVDTVAYESNLNAYFVCDKVERDWKQNKKKVRLIEKA